MGVSEDTYNESRATGARFGLKIGKHLRGFTNEGGGWYLALGSLTYATAIHGGWYVVVAPVVALFLLLDRIATKRVIAGAIAAMKHLRAAHPEAHKCAIAHFAAGSKISTSGQESEQVR